MRIRLLQLQLLLLAPLALGAFSGYTSASAAPAASAPHAAAATPRAAVLTLARPFYLRSAQHAACNAVTGKLAACPLTQRLRAALARELRWEHKHTLGGNANGFCRCQNPPTRVVITAVNASGSVARVQTVWYWATRPMKLTYVTRSVAGGWQIDNSFCTGHPKTDLYHIPVGPCPNT